MTQPGFKDYFSASAAEYATYRPTYPAALFEFVAGLVARRRSVWDCATGSGQAAVPLAEYFDRVIATDASREQVAHAMPHPRVSYGVALADASGIDHASVDLVTVAQALHWLPLERFFAEVRRVLVPSGVLAVWCYTKPLLGGELDDVFDRYYSGECRPYWPPERSLVDTGYSTIAMPFDDIPAPPLHIEQSLSLDGFAGYVRTWSATRKLAAALGHDPVPALIDRMRPRWGATDVRIVRWPIHVRAGRVHTA